jgi:peptidoglycan/xylan/chitin deacetylase (PgdA/CDA1 family)
MGKDKKSNFSGKIRQKLVLWSPHSVIFPFYHAISDQYCPHLKNLYCVHGVQQFEKDLDQLLHFMTPLSVGDAIHDFRKNSLGKPSFHISFDDGLREAKDVIAPILLKKGIPATFFITSGFTNNTILFHRHKVSLIVEMLKHQKSAAVLNKLGSILDTNKSDKLSLQNAVKAINFKTASKLDKIAQVLDVDFAEFLKQEQPYLNAPEIKELACNGFSIGLHSLNHPEFHLLNESEMTFQITESSRKLNELTNIESKLYSFPFTDSGIPDHFIRNVIEQYKITTFGAAGIKDDLINGHFQRIPMDARPSKSAIQLIANEILQYKVKVLFGRQKVKR